MWTLQWSVEVRRGPSSLREQGMPTLLEGAGRHGDSQTGPYSSPYEDAAPDDYPEAKLAMMESWGSFLRMLAPGFVFWVVLIILLIIIL